MAPSNMAQSASFEIDVGHASAMVVADSQRWPSFLLQALDFAHATACQCHLFFTLAVDHFKT
jgi:hypothetical protein